MYARILSRTARASISHSCHAALVTRHRGTSSRGSDAPADHSSTGLSQAATNSLLRDTLGFQPRQVQRFLSALKGVEGAAPFGGPVEQALQQKAPAQRGTSRGQGRGWDRSRGRGGHFHETKVRPEPTEESLADAEALAALSEAVESLLTEWMEKTEEEEDGEVPLHTGLHRLVTSGEALAKAMGRLEEQPHAATSPSFITRVAQSVRVMPLPRLPHRRDEPSAESFTAFLSSHPAYVSALACEAARHLLHSLRPVEVSSNTSVQGAAVALVEALHAMTHLESLSCEDVPLLFVAALLHAQQEGCRAAVALRLRDDLTASASRTAVVLSLTLSTRAAASGNTSPAIAKEENGGEPSPDDLLATAVWSAKRLVSATHRHNRSRHSPMQPPAAESALPMANGAAHMLWLLAALRCHHRHRQPTTAPWSTTERQAWSLLETLWERLLLPPVPPPRSRDTQRLHRTPHSALNILLSEAAERGKQLHRQLQQNARNGDADAQTRALGQALAAQDGWLFFWWQHPQLARALLTAATSLTEELVAPIQAATGRGKTGSDTGGAPRPWSAAALAVGLRTVLDMELRLSLVSMQLLGAPWAPPLRLERPHRSESATTNVAAAALGVQARPLPGVTGDAQMQWRLVHEAALGLQAAVAQLVHVAYRSLVTAELQKDAGSSTSYASPTQSQKLPSRRFLGMMERSFNPLLRRHYLMTGGRAGSPQEPGWGTVYDHCLAVFQLLGETSTPLSVAIASLQAREEGEEEEQPQQQQRRPAAVEVRGLPLFQALEVMFFMVYRALQRDSSGGSSNCKWSSTLEARQEYVKDVLYTLEHNTAKQLWHLRRVGTLYDFTGLLKDGVTFLPDEAVRLRHAQSTLGVVYAHVMHPSLLWMPLWQVQELLLVLSQHRDLILLPTTTSSEGEGRITESDPQPVAVHASLDALAHATAASADRPDATPAPMKRPTVHVAGVATDFGRLHGYFVMRLYVLSNALRCYRDALVEAPSTYPKQREQLTEVAALEPPAERQRRASRPWATTTARLLMSACPQLAAEVEGVAGGGGGAWRGPVRALQRLESAAHTAMDRGLLFRVAEETRRAQRQRRDAKRASAAASLAAMAANEACSVPGDRADCGPPIDAVEERRVVVQRPDLGAPLGFTVDGSSGAILRVTEAAALEGGVPVQTPPPPFAAAVAARGEEPVAYVGWRVVAVDGAPGSGRELARLLAGKQSFELTLRSPPPPPEV